MKLQLPVHHLGGWQHLTQIPVCVQLLCVCYLCVFLFSVTVHVGVCLLSFRSIPSVCFCSFCFVAVATFLLLLLLFLPSFVSSRSLPHRLPSHFTRQESPRQLLSICSPPYIHYSILFPLSPLNGLLSAFFFLGPPFNHVVVQCCICYVFFFN